MHTLSRLVLAALLLVAMPALAEDYVPILPGQTPGNTPNNPPAANNDGNNPSAPAANAPDTDRRMAVPDYIKPGFQMTYMGGGQTEVTDGVKSGMGFTEYTILAVLDDKVLVSATNYLAPNGIEVNADGSFDYESDSRAQLSQSKAMMIKKADVLTGEALWMPVDQFKKWESNKKFEVGHRFKPYQGKTVKAFSIGFSDNDIAYLNTFHAENGLKLEMISNYKDGKQYSQMQLLGTRQIDSPLVGAKWPNWAKTVKKMNYKGTYSMSVAGGPPVTQQIASEVVFKERGDGWAIGKASMTTQGKSSGSSHVMQGPGTMLGYWVHPDVLANLDQGVVDENKILHTSTTYEVQDTRLGRLGMFVQTNKTKSFVAIAGYNLQNGVLTYVGMHTADVGTSVELAFDGMESE